ncbi:MAG: filamentous hemagglutinin N-terminal domain-containing protein, partial [Magnetococcales bacterium]|nr:filamentous hemagglutinin N-terminal domain-containing protein [Magnetococcales bacterium]
MKTRTKHLVVGYFHLIILAMICIARTSWSLPEGSSVQGGATSIITNGPSMTIQQESDRAIIDWQRFNIQTGETLTIQQPSPGSWLLNRIQDNLPSQILGNLDANGHVFLVNPHGLHFGPGSVIDVGGLVASTHEIDDAKFLAGHLEFHTSNPIDGASVENRGRITVDEGSIVTLSAPRVVNSGTIEAMNGSVVLAADPSFLLRLKDYPLLSVEVDQKTANIIARGSDAEKKNLADQALRQAMNIDGVEVAKGASIRGNRLYLHGGSGVTSVNGTLDARPVNSSEKGGTIDVFGNAVSIREQAHLDASGKGGGVIRVGGDYQGSNPAVSNAQTTQIMKGAKIAADALESGDGGRVILWSDQTTQHHGTVSAKGGKEGGDGGFIEISGKKQLSVTGNSSTAAPKGRPGTTLFDPANLIIGNPPGDADDLEGAENPDGDPQTYATNEDETINGSIDDVNMSTTVIENAMDNGHVILNATQSITVDKAISHNGGNNLTLNAGTSMAVNKSITVNSGTIDLTAGTTLTTAANANLTANGSGNINLTSGSTMTLGADITSAGGAITLNAGTSSIQSNAGTQISTSGLGNIILTGGGGITLGGTINGKDVTFSSTSGNITTNNTVTATGPVTWTASGNNAIITVGNTLNSSGDITLKATGSSGQVLNNAAITTTGTGKITLEASGTSGIVTSSANLTSNSGDIELSSGTGGSTTVNNALSSTSGSITLAAGTTVSLKNTASGNNITLRASDSGSTTTADTGATLTASGTVTLSAGTTLAIKEAITASGVITLTASDTSGTITTAKTLSTNGAANITATAGG